MEVFSNKWLKTLRLRYEISGVSAPGLYRLATESHWQPVRETIQKWVDKLPESSQKKIVDKIRNPKSFLHTYNELKIAGILLKQYPQVEYEEKILGLTPDWVVKNRSGEITLIVEVLTREISNEERSLTLRLNALWEKITRIKIGVGLDLSFGDEFDERAFDSKVIKQISLKVERWLKENPVVGTEKLFHDFEFKIISYNDKWTNAQMMGPARSFWVGSLSLKEIIEEKIKKYTNLIKDLKVPFVVGVVPDFSTGVSKSTLEDILLGQEVFAIDGDRAPLLGRASNGIFNERKNISAVIGYFEGDIETFHNPNAIHPLTKNLQSQLST